MVLNWKMLHLRAYREARQAHTELTIDISRRIDPFAALEASRIVVMRQKLDGVAGLYIPPDQDEEAPAGVLISSVHPLSRQRFTAAHELSHHRRDKQLIVDRQTGLAARGGTGIPEIERFADAFASWFLMPPSLVEATLAALDLQAARLTPRGAYLLSLELGTSYDATVYHLLDMEMLHRTQANQLLRSTPQSIKQSMGVADVLADAWRDVWLVGSERPKGSIQPIAGDAVVIEVAEIPSSGYIWLPAPLPEGIDLVREEYRDEDDRAAGGRGVHRFVFRVASPGQQDVFLEMRRPWQNDSTAEVVRVPIVSSARPGIGIVEPLTLVQRAA